MTRKCEIEQSLNNLQESRVTDSNLWGAAKKLWKARSSDWGLLLSSNAYNFKQLWSTPSPPTCAIRKYFSNFLLSITEQLSAVSTMPRSVTQLKDKLDIQHRFRTSQKRNSCVHASIRRMHQFEMSKACRDSSNDPSLNPTRVSQGKLEAIGSTRG